VSGDALRAVVGLGSNVGDRLGALRAAVRAIARVATVEAVSRVYETAPVGGPPQGDYLNAAVLVRYEGAPRALLGELLAIEKEMGRVRREKWGPRVLDLDVLWIEGRVVKEEDLEVPHPGLVERAFALAPMKDVARDAIDPRTGEPFPPPPEGQSLRLVQEELGGSKVERRS
jgi:2-amino-4-hydroxy-6-hydroxymethyldihydropteridine diphosphokinase